MDFAERDQCKTVRLRLSLAGNLEKCPSMGPEWRERGYIFMDVGFLSGIFSPDRDDF